MNQQIRQLLGCLAIYCLSSAVNADLESRAGGLAVYDTDMDITWVSNPKLSATESFGYANASTNMSFAGTLAWIDAMNSANYLGVNTWRLPTSAVTCGTNGCTTGDIITNEFQHLLDSELGGDIFGTDPDLSLFVAVFGTTTSYWTSSQAGPEYPSNWYLTFSFRYGNWNPSLVGSGHYAMPLVDGDPLVPHVLRGDVGPWNDPDGLINAADVLIAAQLVLGHRTPGTLQYAYGDMNSDDVINASDLLLITQEALEF